MPRLVIFDDCVRGVDLPDRAVIIGRSRKVDIPVRDSILSRKHCSIVPMDTGYRLLDLKSQNGTFLNGQRVEKADLAFEDVIEIGNTVIVFLDTETWNRGEQIGWARHPLKARELIRRLERQADGPSGRGVSIESAPPERSGNGAARQDVAARPARVEILEDLVLHEFAKRQLRASPELRRLVGRAVRELEKEAEPRSGDDSLRRRARRILEEIGGASPLAPSGQGAEAPAGPPLAPESRGAADGEREEPRAAPT